MMGGDGRVTMQNTGAPTDVVGTGGLISRLECRHLAETCPSA